MSGQCTGQNGSLELEKELIAFGMKRLVVSSSHRLKRCHRSLCTGMLARGNF